MTTTATCPEGACIPELVKLGRALEHWRGRARRGRRIPEDLWREAGRLARAHGVSAVSSALSLNYYDLQRRAEVGSVDGEPAVPPVFIELRSPTPDTAPGSGGTVEVIHRCGDRLVVRLPELGPEVLLPVVRTFLERRP